VTHKVSFNSTDGEGKRNESGAFMRADVQADGNANSNGRDVSTARTALLTESESDMVALAMTNTTEFEDAEQLLAPRVFRTFCQPSRFNERQLPQQSKKAIEAANNDALMVNSAMAMSGKESSLLPAGSEQLSGAAYSSVNAISGRNKLAISWFGTGAMDSDSAASGTEARTVDMDSAEGGIATSDAYVDMSVLETDSAKMEVELRDKESNGSQSCNDNDTASESDEVISPSPTPSSPSDLAADSGSEGR
jgi:hypothetical protein